MAAVGAGGREVSEFVLHRIALRKMDRKTRRFPLPSTATLPLSGQSFGVLFRGLSNQPNCCDTWGEGAGRRRRRQLAKSNRQPISDRI